MGVDPDTRELHYVSCENVKRIQDLWFIRQLLLSLGSFLSPGQRVPSVLRVLLFKERDRLEF